MVAKRDTEDLCPASEGDHLMETERSHTLPPSLKEKNEKKNASRTPFGLFTRTIVAGAPLSPFASGLPYCERSQSALGLSVTSSFEVRNTSGPKLDRV